jgi:hypothetical protein
MAVDWSAIELGGYLASAADPAIQRAPTRCPPWSEALRSRAGQLMGHQRGPVPVGLQVIWGLSELAVHHDDLADATGTSYRPSDPVVAALVEMKEAIDGFHGGDDSWLDYLRSTGRDPKSP